MDVDRRRDCRERCGEGCGEEIDRDINIQGQGLDREIDIDRGEGY